MRTIAVLSVLLSAAPAAFAIPRPDASDMAAAQNERRESRPQPSMPVEGLLPANNRSDQGLVEVRHPRGGYSKSLQGRFQEYYVATRGAEGSLVTACVNDAAQAERILKAAGSVPVAQGSDR